MPDRARLLPLEDPVERAHGRPHGSRDLPERDHDGQREPVRVRARDQPLHDRVDRLEGRVREPVGDARRELVAPDPLLAEDAHQQEREQRERDDRGQQLQSHRARVREDVVAVEALDDHAEDPDGHRPDERARPALELVDDVASGHGFRFAHPRAYTTFKGRRQAVAARSYGDSVAQTYFFSTSGGRTAAIQDAWPDAGPQPYLVSVDDPTTTSRRTTSGARPRSRTASCPRTSASRCPRSRRWRARPTAASPP